MPREPGSNASRPCDLSHVPRPIAPPNQESRAPRSAKKHRPSPSSGRPQRPTTKPIGHDRSDSGHDLIDRPIVPTDSSNAAVDPKLFLKPDLHNSSPKSAPTYQD
ncbi:unnamed protein product [Microthlaspi erraticum]|uniref:Uncharacterized protein n=1 Tax=Microthlaspi erraticum TaxID=1685480 RepID=A0A6D2JEU2_9BRAS|nr:unnamed protein product [Microthlaspi erraticum]CAA7057045.1 unnamed protein product [Microthlaspi erraticum]